MKRIIALLLVLVCLVSMLACSATNIAVEEETETVEATTTKKKVTTTTKEKKEKEEPAPERPEYEATPNYCGTKNFDPFDTVKFKYRGIADLQKEVDALAATYKPSDEGKVILYGDSHFTRWSSTHADGNLNAADELNATNVLNHGFGSSTMHDLVLHYNELVKPWNPSALIISSYVNGYDYTAAERIQLTDWLVNRATQDFPDIKIYILEYSVLLKDRSSLMKDINTINQQLHELTKKYPNLKIIEHSKEASFYEAPQYAGTYTHPKESFFLSDEVHFTRQGYAAFAEMIKREAKDVLEFKGQI